MARRVEEGGAAFFHHYPRVAALVTCRARGLDNVMAAAWHTPLSRKPLLFGVSIAPQRFSYELIMEAREFGVNFLPLERANLIAAVGGVSGRGGDKFRRFQIGIEQPILTSVPIMVDAYAAYECVLHEHVTIGDHELFVGRVVATHFDDEAITPDGAPDVSKVQPALFLPKERYGAMDPSTVRYVPRLGYNEAALLAETGPLKRYGDGK